MNRRTKRQTCRGCGAKQSRMICGGCMSLLPEFMRLRAQTAMKNRLGSAKDTNWFSIAVAWLEDWDGFWQRLEGVTDDTART